MNNLNNIQEIVLSNIENRIVVLDINTLEYVYFNKAYSKMYSKLFNIKLELGQNASDNLKINFFTDYTALVGMIKRAKKENGYFFKGRYGKIGLINMKVDIIGNLILFNISDSETPYIKSLEIEELKAFIDSVFNKTVVGIAVVTLDGYLERVNNKFAEFLEYDDPEKLKGLHFKDITHPDDVEKDLELFHKLISGDIQHYKIQKKYITKNNNIVYGTLKVENLKVGNSKVIAHVLNDNELTYSLNKLQLALESAVIGIWEYDIEDDYLYWDNQMLSIYEITNKEELTNTFNDWKNRLHPEDVYETIDDLHKAMLNSSYNFEKTFRIITPANEIKYIKPLSRAIFNANGKAVKIIGVNIDITQSIIREKELLENTQELENFAHITTHDLQEPLRMIKQYSSILAEDNKDYFDEESLENLNFIQTGVEKMSELINGVLDYSRIKKIPKKIEIIDLNKLLLDYNTYNNKELNIIIPEKLPSLYADYNLIKQLFYNIFSNANKYNNSKMHKVEITYKIGKNVVEFRIKDNGIGIKKEYHEQIFKLFKRLHNDKKYSGTGIGLALCDKIVKLYDGEIHVESEFNKGSTFIFTLKNVVSYE
jgi:two-component system CheB/CheR fusion protein